MIPVVGDDVHSPETLVSPNAEHQGLRRLKLTKCIGVLVFVDADDFTYLGANIDDQFQGTLSLGTLYWGSPREPGDLPGVVKNVTR